MRGISSGRLFVAVAVTGLLVPLPVGGIAVAATVEQPADSTATDGLQVSGTTGNNSTIQHRNPADVREFGDLIRVRDWLSSDLEERLSESAIQLRQEEYRRARTLLGDGYSDRLGQYVDVTRQTSGDVNEGSIDRYRETRQTQQNLTRSVQRYEQTYDEYQRALANGNETRARQVARQLDTIEQRVQGLNRSVQRDYSRLENQTGGSLSETRLTVANVTRNISARQERVESELFVETELRLDTDDSRISYTDPLTVRGRLVTAGGEPVGDREITLLVHARRQQVTTNASGYFDLRYRPRTIPVNRSSVAVTYIPTNTSEYQRTTSAVDVRIEQVTASLSVTVDPDRAAYGADVVIETRLTVDGDLVTGVPVNATIGDYRVPTSTTAEGGNGTRRVVVPADVESGQRLVTVTAGNGSTAVTTANATATLDVLETETTLSLGRTASSETVLRFGGRLATDEGAAISGQPVVVAVGDAVERLVRTGPDGGFNLSVSRDRLVLTANGTVRVTARYSGEGRNLNGSAASLQIVVNSGRESGRTGIASILPVSEYVAIGVGGAGLLLGTLLFARWRLDDSSESARTEQVTEPVSEDDTSDETAAESRSQRGGTDVSLDLTPGRAFLESGDEAAAVRYTYQHLREHVADSVGVDRSETHWEFFDACRNRGLDESQLETLRTLVEVYERVSFREDHVPDPNVGELLSAVEETWGPRGSEGSE